MHSYYLLARYDNGQGSSFQSVVGCKQDSGAPLDLPYDFRTSFDLTTVMWQVVLASKRGDHYDLDGEMMVRFLPFFQIFQLIFIIRKILIWMKKHQLETVTLSNSLVGAHTDF